MRDALVRRLPESAGTQETAESLGRLTDTGHKVATLRNDSKGRVDDVVRPEHIDDSHRLLRDEKYGLGE